MTQPGFRPAWTAMLPCVLALLVTSWAAAASDAPRAADRLQVHRDSMLDVIVTYQEYNAFLPWQKERPGTRIGHGAVVGDGLVLTTEDLVRNHTLIELRKSEGGEKVSARVVQADEQVNLALLKIEPGGRAVPFGELEPIALAEGMPEDGTVQILQFDDTDQIQVGDARIIKAAYSSLPTAPHAVLMYKALTDLNVDRRAALALSEDRLVGIVAAYDSGGRTAYLLPHPLLRRFVETAQQTPYRGFATAGFSWAPLLDPVKREWLGVPEGEHGVLVQAVLPGTGAGESLRPNDVVLSWDGRPVSNQGFYEDPDYGRIQFGHLIKGHRAPGDVSEVRIIRDREARTVPVMLSRPDEFAALIPENTLGAPVDYVVEAGLVLRELTGDYLRAYGANWWARIDPSLAHLYNTAAAQPEEPGDRVVLLAAVLPDPINIGYQHLGIRAVESVNGRPVRNMDDVFDILLSDRVIRRIRLAHVGVELALDAEHIPEANARLAQTYRIPQLRRRAPATP